MITAIQGIHYAYTNGEYGIFIFGNGNKERMDKMLNKIKKNRRNDGN